jgi:hypothetical protein
MAVVLPWLSYTGVPTPESLDEVSLTDAVATGVLREEYLVGDGRSCGHVTVAPTEMAVKLFDIYVVAHPDANEICQGLDTIQTRSFRLVKNLSAE